MANVEKSGTMKYKDKSGNMTTMYPKTKVANVEGLSTELDKKAPLTHTHTKSQISDFPTSMPASDVKAWAKAATKPSYTASEVGADASGAAAQALTDAKTYTDGKISDSQKLDLPVAASSSDGVAYSATVPGATLTAGYSFIMIPNRISSSTSTTLNVNGLGAKALRVHVSGYTGTTSAPMTNNWLAPNKPVRVTYDGMWWITDVVLPSAQQLYGNVQAEDVDYSNTSSGLTATKVQAAIDELAGGALRTQTMTTAEYEALTTKDENTFYMLSDAEETSGDSIFWVTYNDSTLTGQMLVDARDTNKLVCCYYYGQLFVWASYGTPAIPDATDYVFLPVLGVTNVVKSEDDNNAIASVYQSKSRCLLFSDKDNVGQGRTWSIIKKANGFVPESIHASQHATGGADPITPASIGAATMTEVKTAIQTAIGDAIGGSY